MWNFGFINSGPHDASAKVEHVHCLLNFINEYFLPVKPIGWQELRLYTLRCLILQWGWYSCKTVPGFAEIGATTDNQIWGRCITSVGFRKSEYFIYEILVETIKTSCRMQYRLLLRYAASPFYVQYLWISMVTFWIYLKTKRNWYHISNRWDNDISIPYYWSVGHQMIYRKSQLWKVFLTWTILISSGL